LFTEVAEKGPNQAERRIQSLAVLSKQFAGGMVFPGEVAAPFDQLWQKMEEAILINKEPIKQVLAKYEKEYDKLLGGPLLDHPELVFSKQVAGKKQPATAASEDVWPLKPPNPFRPYPKKPDPGLNSNRLCSGWCPS
jgi:hypothetical protein